LAVKEDYKFWSTRKMPISLYNEIKILAATHNIHVYIIVVAAIRAGLHNVTVRLMKGKRVR